MLIRFTNIFRAEFGKFVEKAIWSMASLYYYYYYQNSFRFSLIFKFGNPGEVLIAKALICTRKQNPEVVKPDKPVCPLMGPEAPCCSGGLCCLCLLIIHFIL